MKDKERLQDILNVIKAIEAYTRGFEYNFPVL